MLFKNRKSFVLNFAVILVLLSGMFGVELTKASAETDNFLSSAGFLDPDGTLKLNHSVSGLINLQGWNVKVDDERGPIFSTKESELPSPIMLSAPGEWSALGSNLAGNDGALNNGVNAIAVDGTNVYVGGGFTDAGGIAAADYIAKWNGTNWSALGSNGAANGPLNNYVTAIAVIGSNVYVSGGFTNINNGGTTL